MFLFDKRNIRGDVTLKARFVLPIGGKDMSALGVKALAKKTP